MPKTGGQALSTWLVSRLGTGCVSPDLMGNHRELIETYGGHHSIISGHLHFFEGETLDPRYQYITCLREPVDRVLSWLFYILNDSAVNERSKPIKEVAEVFLRSEGKECPSELIYGYSNYYVYHFSSIAPRKTPPQRPPAAYQDDKFKAAITQLSQFDVVGIYEDFPGFTAEVTQLIGVDQPKQVPKVNVSTQRPGVNTISKAMRDRIIELNQDDIRLYSEVLEWKKQRPIVVPPARSLFGWLRNSRKPTQPPAVTAVGEPNHRVHWVKYEPPETALTAAYGSLSAVSPPSSFAPDEQKIIQVTITNTGFQNWRNSAQFPLMAGYRWLLPSGEVYDQQDVRTPLPLKALAPAASVTVNMAVVAPREPGAYTLVLTVLQEYFARLDQRGFTPAVVQISVAKPIASARIRAVKT